MVADGVLVAYLGKCEGVVCGRTERKRLQKRGKSVVVTDRQLQMQCRVLTERMSIMQDMLGTMHKDLNMREEFFNQSHPLSEIGRTLGGALSGIGYRGLGHRTGD